VVTAAPDARKTCDKSRDFDFGEAGHDRAFALAQTTAANDLQEDEN